MLEAGSLLNLLHDRLGQHALMDMGVVEHVEVPDLVSARSLMLVGPLGRGFWRAFCEEPEYSDGLPDPIDRWSKRVISQIASDFGGTPLFPFTGPPYLPFYTWAIESRRSFPSPIGFLVHDVAGLWGSFRGAIAFGHPLPVEPESTSPCENCLDKPCVDACPVSALSPEAYNVHVCHNHLDGPAGSSCLNDGCRARSICPQSKSFGRDAGQSAHHMKAFHK